MKKHLLLITVLGAFLVSCSSTKTTLNDLATNNPIEAKLDLVNLTNDRVPVNINPGRFTSENVTYRLPKVVQGTYAVSDFGRYVDDFKAFDYKGNELATNKKDTNTWTIANATNLDYITYNVNDTFDVEEVGGIGGEVPFSPSGTNITPENFVLNLHGFIGYFDSLKSSQYKIDVSSPSSLVKSSALQEVSATSTGNTTTTSYFAPRYFDVTDNPMMYGKLDVEEFMVGDIKIVLSVYSPNNVHTAAGLKETVYKMMQGQKEYLGDINSTPRYDVYLYLADGSEGSPKGFGALEHHTSTVVVLPENSTKEQLAKSMIDVVAHEFFHIVTPLSVHSEDVHYFDYYEPTFSKHLWMYEGVTEYFAQHFQVYEGLVTPEEFYNTIIGKINVSKRLDDTMSFTEMSENILEEPYASNYYNVYQKGALIGMCIDILMREESKGQRSMLSLMKELSNKYGTNKPFEDDKIIDDIIAITYPSVGEFLNTHVVGKTPIDYDQFFAKAGLVFDTGKVETTYVRGSSGFIFGADREKGQLFFAPSATENSFWAEQGVQGGDVIKSLNGTAVSLQNAQSVVEGMFQWAPGQEIEVVLDRNGTEQLIKTKLTPAFTNSKILKESAVATEKQNSLRKAWLKG